MSDESTDDTRPTDDTAPNETAPPAEVDDGERPAAERPTRSGVFVPLWLAVLVGVIVVIGLIGGGGFALGRATAGDDDHVAVVRRVPRSELPFPRNPGGPNLPANRAFLGVAVESASGNPSGARIVRVVGSGPAADAGLRTGDVITKVGSDTVSDAGDLASGIRGHRPGDHVRITYDRNGSSHTTRVTLGRPGSTTS